MKLSLIIATSCTASLAVGAAAGYFFAKNQLRLEFEELSKREIEEAKEFYQVLHKKGEYDTPVKAAEKLQVEPAKSNEFSAAAAAMRVYSGVDKGPLEKSEVVTTRTLIEEHNVFEKPEQKINLTDADWQKELRDRTDDFPYVISVEEYAECGEDFVQASLTYYAGDDVLVDEREDRIEEVDETVGLYNLKKFGHWSGDSRVVYVRNPVKEVEFEILLHDGKFSEEVLGLRGDDG